MDRSAVDELVSATYEELRRLAAAVKGADAGETLSPTALVNEAYLKLASSAGFAVASPRHFKRIAARAMRQVLVEAARRRNAQKRGGTPVMVTFDEAIGGAPASPDELLSLDLALRELDRMHPRQARVVELRFFGGLELAEAAEVLDVSEVTVQRDWRAARAWLARELDQRR